MKKFVLIPLLFFVSYLQSQNTSTTTNLIDTVKAVMVLDTLSVYTPIDTANLTVRQDESKKYLENNKKFMEQINSKYIGVEKRIIKSYFEDIHKEINEEILKGDFLFDNRFTKTINNIATEIKSRNSEITQSLTFYISKDITLNAASMGDDNFLVNMGVFSHLFNEDEVAAILSHEIAHLTLDHAIKDLQKDYERNKSETKKDVKELKKETSNRSEKAWEKIRKIAYDDRKDKRQNELDADSLGYIYFKNTKYDQLAYIRTMRLFSEYDSIKPEGVEQSTYKKVFDLPNQPFNEKWLKMEDFNNYTYSFQNKFNEDSLKSHPEMEERIARLKQNFPELEKANDTIKVSAEFSELQKIAIMEQPVYLMKEEEYGIGIYFCLLNLQSDEKDEYYKKWLGDFFIKMYDARKSYTANRYLEQINPTEQSESYQQFLSFMWNLRPNEMKNIADFYMKKGS